MNSYQLKFKDGSTLNYPVDSLDRARTVAQSTAGVERESVEIHQTNPHPLAHLGITYANPVCIIRPNAHKVSHDSLANLSGHAGGDVRESSCDPEVYPYVLFEKGLSGDNIYACHPEYGDIGRLGSTRAEAIERLKQLQH